MLQVGIGLLVLQQLGGINGVLFYSSTIFASAGKSLKPLSLTFGTFLRDNKHCFSVPFVFSLRGLIE